MKPWKWLKHYAAVLAICLLTWIQMMPAAFADQKPKEATAATETINQAVKDSLPFDKTGDFERSSRGFIAGALPENIEGGTLPIIKDGDKEVWNLEQYKFLLDYGSPYHKDKDYTSDWLDNLPFEVNPSLWRMAQLNMNYGLYQVVPGIYQVRGYDLAVMTLIAGETGWIVVDPLTSNETAEAVFKLAVANYDNMVQGGEHYLPYNFARGFNEAAISALIYTHSHVDHYGGVRGVLPEYGLPDTEIPIYAPIGFLEEAVSENLFAGNVMSRRATYMYGNLIAKGETGQVDGGLGKTTSSGTVSVLEPTEIIDDESGSSKIDGVTVVWQNVPDSEAPAEMLFYFPEFHAFCASEDATRTLHNLYTLRGAKVRDAIGWANYLSEAIEMLEQAEDPVEVVFASHHWPTWDDDETTDENEVIEYLKKQRDLYKYLHDQTLHLANQGYTMLEIAEMFELPAALADEWYNREYYGSVNHNVKAVYQRYLGWFDGNPAHLYTLPPERAGHKYIEYMGGPQKAIELARADYADAANTESKLASEDYRWVAQVMSDVVFGYCDPSDQSGIDPDQPHLTDCQEARLLEADALEQLGYQAESGAWRNFFLGGAKELRDGVPTISASKTASPDVLKAIPSDLLFDYLAILMDGPRAAEKRPFTLKLLFSDPSTPGLDRELRKDKMPVRNSTSDERYVLSIENGVLNYSDTTDAVEDTETDASLEITREDFNRVILREAGFYPSICLAPCEVLTPGEDYLSEDPDGKFLLFLSLLEPFAFWFNIVLP